MLIAGVAVEKAAYSFDKAYDFLVPPELGEAVRPGCRVTVPFGSGSRTRQGLVLTLRREEQAPPRLKAVLSCGDAQPVLGGEQLALLQFLKEHTFCTYFEALRVLIPAGLGADLRRRYALRGEPAPQQLEELDEEGRRLLDYLRQKRLPVPQEELLRAFGLADDRRLRALVDAGLLCCSEDLQQRVQDEKLTMVRLTGQEPEKLTPKQRAVVEFLGQVGCASVKEVCYFAAVTRAVVERLVACGAVEAYQQEVYRNPYAGRGADPQPICLSPAQQQVYEGLCALWQEGRPATALLYGVTGSGKTQVFLKLIEQVLAAGRQVIVMVPEISLTPQTLDKFHRQFGLRIAVLHSGLSLGERMDEFKRIRRGEADIVVGTRSAVFAPVERLGLVVMDEEQEHTYKSEQSPRFHAREVAAFRCRRQGALLLLASATPSIESYYRAKRGEYRLFTIQERFTGSRLPDVYLVDMNDEPDKAFTNAISTVLAEELYLNLRQGEQSILLLNRRGYNTVVKCTQCGQVVSCPHCSIALTYHTANGRLLCHYCGYSLPMTRACPACGSEQVRYAGIGTQRVQEQLQQLYPDARVLRMDMDTTMSKFAYDRSFREFAEGKYDIMVGTQMVAKGLDFPRVTLVGVLAADQSLYSDDFRACERTFSLITQVVGRSGRGARNGRAYIQTTVPAHPVLNLAAAQRYDAFYQEEIAARRLGLYPPFCDVCLVGFTGLVQKQVLAAAQRFSAGLAELARAEYPDLPLRVLGPSEAAVLRVSGKYRYKLLLKCRDNRRTRAFLEQLLRRYYDDRQNREVTVFLDLHYDSNF